MKIALSVPATQLATGSVDVRAPILSDRCVGVSIEEPLNLCCVVLSMPRIVVQRSPKANYLFGLRMHERTGELF